ncbi:hypothetical protein [uncultured Ruminococcus sp.]|uniref:hypothetical protein n=1 Tax=uncultured Ruminococcus sp. TaxID=165186 RepID=UPI00263A1D42|nr:hypothetical protein [uncultured Ruminococcus sp.]
MELLEVLECWKPTVYIVFNISMLSMISMLCKRGTPFKIPPLYLMLIQKVK